jgi:predicted DNA-binding transcriptional regulator AlpA
MSDVKFLQRAVEEFATGCVPPPPSSEPDRFVRWQELKTLFGVTWSRKHVYTLMERGLFPKDYLIGGRTKAWKFSELMEWQRTAETDYRCQPPEKKAG